MYSFVTYLMMFLHMFVGLILIGVILLQRGRGGGLAGAFGGMGGQSAFGTKAGDVFTKITIVLATIWIVLGCVCVLLASNYKYYKSSRVKFDAVVPAVPTAPEDEKPGAGASKADEKDAKGDTKDEKKDDVLPGPADSEKDAKPKAEVEPTDDGKAKPDDAPAKPEAKDKEADPAAAKESPDKKPE